MKADDRNKRGEDKAMAKRRQSAPEITKRRSSITDRDELAMINLDYKKEDDHQDGEQHKEEDDDEVPDAAVYQENDAEDVVDKHVDQILDDVRGGKRFWRVTWYLEEVHGVAEAYRWSWTEEELIHFAQLRLRSNVHRGELSSQILKEVNFVLSHFRQRRCKQFCRKPQPELSKTARVQANGYGSRCSQKRKFCACGLDNERHSMEALQNKTKTWTPDTTTETTLPFNFGRIVVLSTPRPYLRLDDLDTDSANVWRLLIGHWKIKAPNMVISVTGGDVTQLKSDLKLHKKFREGLRKSALTTSAWLITNGLENGSTKEMGEIFQEGRIGEHANNMSLIGIAPWGMITGRDEIAMHGIGIHPPCSYRRPLWGVESSSKESEELDSYLLDQNHTAFLLADNGQYWNNENSCKVRDQLEKYIQTKTTCALLGTKEVKTPLIILVLGGDAHTLQKLKFACSLGISIVVVNGSGPIADMCADVYKILETRMPRSNKRMTEWSLEEESLFMDTMQKYIRDNVVEGKEGVDNLREVMMSRHLMEIFGLDDGDINDLDKAILTAIFSGLTDIAAQLSLALAMDRSDITRNTIFIDSRKRELSEQKDVLEAALHVALRGGRREFVELLLDRDCGADVSLKSYLTVTRLRELHQENLKESHVVGSILKSLCMRGRNGYCNLDDAHLLPQVGRIIYWLMGNNYKLLYQQKRYSEGDAKDDSSRKRRYSEMEALFHLFIWAVLGNRLELAELFLSKTTCKIGAGLIAFKLLVNLSKKAKRLAEYELSSALQQNGQYFQTLSINTLTELYELNRQEAYVNLVAMLPFKWGRYVTPVSIAQDAKAMRFMGHACCQTYINLVWIKHMNLNTPYWTLFPLFAFAPFINIPFILFDTESLRIGSYRKLRNDEEDADVERNQANGECNGKVKTLSAANLQDDVKENRLSCETSQNYSNEEPVSNPSNNHSNLQYGWFCLKTYYTAPCTKFLLNLVTYLVFLGMFCRMLVSDLAPFKTWDDISVYEWAVIVWELSLLAEEVKQILYGKASGPLYDNKWYHFSSVWRDTWTFGERFFFVMRLYMFNNWLTDIWNVFDLILHLCLVAAIVLRFSLDPVDFYVARIIYTLAMVLSFMRTLRMGYVVQQLGPRIMSIGKLMKDLIYFLVILAIFILSFGIAFQALIDGNVPPSWELLADIVWRPYWQMYGELFLDDISEGMGVAVRNRTCTTNYTEALAHRHTMEYCHDWVIPVLLGIFMLITNILLLNLLIAIFSHSFDTIESEAEKIWRYHMYRLVHEYYHQSWIPQPLSLIENVLKLLPSIFRLLTYKCCKRCDGSNCCSCCRKKWKAYTHFRQDERMRDSDLETKAYLRGLKSSPTYEEPQSMESAIQAYGKRLQTISSELHDIRQLATAGAKLGKPERHPSKHTKKGGRPPLASRYQSFDAMEDKNIIETTSSEVKQIKATMQQMTERMDTVSKQVDDIQSTFKVLTESMNPILSYVKGMQRQEDEEPTAIPLEADTPF